jgi:glycine/D-amino acid oxidase-like deaminating enzyme
MLATAPATDVKFSKANYRRDGYDYWQQTKDGRIALGGFRDINKDNEWTHNCVPAQPIQGRLEQFLREHIKTKAPITHRWAGLVAYTDDGEPIFEEIR